MNPSFACVIMNEINSFKGLLQLEYCYTYVMIIYFWNILLLDYQEKIKFRPTEYSEDHDDSSVYEWMTHMQQNFIISNLKAEHVLRKIHDCIFRPKDFLPDSLTKTPLKIFCFILPYIHHCKNTLSSLHIFVHHCTFRSSLHILCITAC